LIKTLSKYKAEVSKATKLCLEAINNVDSAVNNSWQVDTYAKEEYLFIKNFVDTMVIGFLLNNYPSDKKKKKKHGNGLL
jgi:RPA family protein